MSKCKAVRTSEAAFKGTQSWEYEALFNLEAYRLRVVIDRDAYDFQTSAQISVLDRNLNAWNPLTFLPTSEMTSMAISYVTEPDKFHKENLIDHFRYDAARLVDKAVLILV
jgi:nicotinamide riboside kinase